MAVFEVASLCFLNIAGREARLMLCLSLLYLMVSNSKAFSNAISYKYAYAYYTEHLCVQ